MMRPLTIGMQASVQRVIDQQLVDEYAALCGDQPQDTVPEPLIGALFSQVLGVELPGAGSVYLLSRKCAKVRTVLFLPRRVLLTTVVSDRRDFPDCDRDPLCRSAAITGRTRHG